MPGPALLERGPGEEPRVRIAREPRTRLFLNVENATARPQVSYQGFNRTDNPEDFTQYGFRAIAGVNLTF